MRGTPVARSWVVVMHNGTVAIDWGGGIYVDIVSSAFFAAGEKDVSHRAQDADLDWLKHLGKVDDYDINYVYFSLLPEYKGPDDVKALRK